jgi:glycosyltransferase involved in cell wall biosynthesis
LVDLEPGATTPKVSVVIPVYNGENYLAQAIESALDQDGVTREILVIDDASTDRTPDIASSYGTRVEYVHLTKQPTSLATTNRGISMARGDYVSVLHHDDFYLPGKLRRHVELMDAHPEIGLSYSAQRYVDPQGNALGMLHSPVRRADYVDPGTGELRHLVVQNYINFCNAVVRRSAYDVVGLYNEPLWFSGEWEMWVKLATHFAVGYIDEPLVCYRLHRQAQTVSGTKDTMAFQRQLRSVAMQIYGDMPLPPALRSRQRFTQANLHLSTALLMGLRGQHRLALASFSRVLHYVRPWELPELFHSAALLPRLVPRARLLWWGKE